MSQRSSSFLLWLAWLQFLAVLNTVQCFQQQRFHERAPIVLEWPAAAGGSADLRILSTPHYKSCSSGDMCQDEGSSEVLYTQLSPFSIWSMEFDSFIKLSSFSHIRDQPFLAKMLWTSGWSRPGRKRRPCKSSKLKTHQKKTWKRKSSWIPFSLWQKKHKTFSFKGGVSLQTQKKAWLTWEVAGHGDGARENHRKMKKNRMATSRMLDKCFVLEVKKKVYLYILEESRMQSPQELVSALQLAVGLFFFQLKMRSSRFFLSHTIWEPPCCALSCLK